MKVKSFISMKLSRIHFGYLYASSNLDNVEIYENQIKYLSEACRRLYSYIVNSSDY